MTPPPTSPRSRPPGTTVALRAPAKVNLHLEVLRQRSDGYHEIETVLQTVDLFDRVSVTLEEVFPGGEPVIAIRTRPRGAAPDDETNLCWRAARLFCHHHQVTGRLRIELEKAIPWGAGLGGGSSDAAATFVACDRLFGTDLGVADLERMGGEIGSDVPFFFGGGTALGRGTGTDLTRLPTIRAGHFLILKPGFELSTAQVYRELKMGLTVRSPAANIQVVSALIARFPTSSWFGYNRLEEVVLPRQPELQRTIVGLREHAPIAMLCGSGSAVVAVSAGADEAGRLAREFDTMHPFVRVVRPHAAGVEITTQ